MNAFIDFTVRLLTDAIQMPGLIGEVALRSPLSAVIVATGTAFILLSVGVLGYSALGALGIPLPNLGSGPNERIE
ncbi:hypothetical protein [Halohasta litorea]|uniref:Uncharacterized protein n=1 Tax=Halohasta litorea TaxID=869891 RepID=A0ABD6D664_9EURY|nr:hypothetical protein [Halohasta litorea]